MEAVITVAVLAFFALATWNIADDMFFRRKAMEILDGLEVLSKELEQRVSDLENKNN